MRRIHIEYLEVGSQESRLVEIPWDRFFDADGLAPVEREYELLKLDPARLVYTVLDVENGGESYRIRTQFFAAGGWMTHRADADGSEELIHVVRVEDQEIIVKTNKPAGHTWMAIGATWYEHSNGPSADLLGLNKQYREPGLLPARAPGSFASIVDARAGRRGPWPAE